jgi:hypothetical protein
MAGGAAMPPAVANPAALLRNVVIAPTAPPKTPLECTPLLRQRQNPQIG